MRNILSKLERRPRIGAAFHIVVRYQLADSAIKS